MTLGPGSGAGRLLHRVEYKWRALFAVALGTFMSTLDSSIVNVSLPALRREFAAAVTTVGWVVMAYLLTVAGLLLSVGRLSDMVGRRRVYNVGFVVFTVGSLGCAAGRSILQLIGARVLQAAGAAMLMANGAAILTASFPRSERGQAMGLNGTIVACGLTVGPPLGGLLIHAFGWRSIFTINVPIGIVGTLLARYLLRPDERSPTQERFDVPGALVLFVSLGALLLALSRGQNWGWSSPAVVGLLAGSALGVALFIGIESRLSHPTVDLTLFRDRLFAAGSVSAVLSYAAIAAAVFMTPFYLNELRRYSIAETGAMMTVVPLTMLVVSPTSGWLSDRVGSRVLSSAGLACLAVALTLLSGLRADTPGGDIAVRLFLVGLGNGLFTSPNSSAIMGAVPIHHLGVASGMIATVRTTGMVIGVAVAGAAFAVRRAHLTEAGLPASDAFAGALGAAFLVAAGIAALGVVPSLVRGREERRAR